MKGHSGRIQRDKVTKQLNVPMIKGEKWYMINLRWWNAWKEFVQFDAKEDDLLNDSEMDDQPFPGPIDNSCLLDEDQSVRDGCLMNYDFDVIPEESWKLLVDAFTCEQNNHEIFQRWVIKLPSGETQVEVHPFQLALSAYKNPTAIETVAFSKYQTFEEVRRVLESRFQMSAQNETRLLTKDKHGRHLILEIKDQDTLENSELSIRQLIILEEKEPSENWKAVTFPVNNTSTPSAPPATTNGWSSGSYGAMGGAASNSLCPSQGSSGRYRQQKGVCGLSNLGNTCFMNSALQCISNVPELTEYFLSGTWESELNEENPLGMHGKIAVSYARLIQNMWSGKISSALTREFKTAVAEFAPQFCGYSQHDSHELLVFLLDGLHEDLNKITKKPYIEIKDANDRPDEEVAMEAWDTHHRRNDSIIVDLFHGLLKSTVICPDCNFVSVTFDPLAALSLPLPVQSEYLQEVHVVPADPQYPVQSMRVKVRKGGCIEDLCRAVGNMADLNPEQLVVADIHDYRIYYRYHMKDRLTRIRSSDVIYVYHLPLNEDDIHIHFTMRYEDASNRHKFGVPFFLIMKKSTLTYQVLLEAILSRLQRFMHNLDDQESGGEQDEDETSSNSSSVMETPFTIQEVSGYNRECEIKPPSEEGASDIIQFDNSRTELIITWTKDTYNTYYKHDEGHVFHTSMDLEDAKVIQLPDCLKQFTNSEQLGEHDLWYCPICKEHKAANKKVDLWDLPKVLVIQLKRFQYSTYIRDKIDSLIDFPIKDLDMRRWVKGAQPSREYLYDLVAVSNHMGGLGGGHYTAYGLNHTTNKWYLFDDSYVCEASEEDLVTRNAYVLVYVRKDEACDPEPDLMDVE